MGTMLKVELFCCMSKRISAPPLLGLPHFPRLPHHPNSLLPFVALGEDPLHGTKGMQAHLDPIFNVHT
jgi:hypothetical protein